MVLFCCSLYCCSLLWVSFYFVHFFLSPFYGSLFISRYVSLADLFCGSLHLIFGIYLDLFFQVSLVCLVILYWFLYVSFVDLSCRSLLILFWFICVVFVGSQFCSSLLWVSFCFFTFLFGSFLLVSFNFFHMSLADLFCGSLRMIFWDLSRSLLKSLLWFYIDFYTSRLWVSLVGLFWFICASFVGLFWVIRVSFVSSFCMYVW